MKIGIIREGKVPPDLRTPLTPSQAAEWMKTYPGSTVVAQASPIRCYSDDEYRSAGVKVVDSLEDCDVILGVKEVPISMLIPGKTYVFFSHTIKKQSHNRALLRAILEKKIRLVDHELLTDARGVRLVAFGRYAGIVGAYNAFRGYGILSGAYDLKPAHACFDRREMEAELEHLKLPRGFRILVTGNGRVTGGIKEVLSTAGVREVDTPLFMRERFDDPTYTILDVTEYNRRLDGKPSEKADFYASPALFEGNMQAYLKDASMLITGHFFASGSPDILPRQIYAHPDFALELIADVSCDVDGPIASTLRASTIAEPFYGYDHQTHAEVPFGAPGSVGVMAVDNLPCELPRDSSKDFGRDFLQRVAPALMGNDPDKVLERASETNFMGELMPRFAYLKEWVEQS